MFQMVTKLRSFQEPCYPLTHPYQLLWATKVRQKTQKGNGSCSAPDLASCDLRESSLKTKVKRRGNEDHLELGP